MNLFIFSTPSGIDIVDEKAAHNYIRTPSGAQKAGLKYLGAIPAIERTNLLKEVQKKKMEKFGAIGQGEANDQKIIDSRAFTENLIEEGMKELIEKADPSIKPRNFDYMYGNIGNLEGSGYANSLAEAKRNLIR